MRRANDLSKVAGIFIVTLPALLAGCMQGDVPPESGGRAAFDNSAVGSSDMPEVIITAQRPRPKTIVLSARDPESTSH
jgi:hypothetical protein